ncbi:MAG TPA: phosphatase PAP2 family protein [Parafilimonas sp.]
MFQKKWFYQLKLFLLLIMFSFNVKAQYNDSLQLQHKYSSRDFKFYLKNTYLPSAFILLGSYSNGNETIIDNGGIKTERDENMPHFKTHVDDYMQYAPLLAGYGCLTFGSRQNAWLYTKEIMMNEIIMNASVYSVKHLSKVRSIVDGSYNAFPSGHTTQAFSAATLFNDNFAKGKLWLQCLSYGSASAVGVLRVLNERHWTSDVVAGAGFGILSAKISEWVITSHHNKKQLSNFN